MIINRFFSMRSCFTFSIPVVQEILKLHVGDGLGWADPFANNSRWAEFANDLNPHTSASSHVDAVEFLQSFPVSSLRGVLLDPPYSLCQVKRTYKGFGSRAVNSLASIRSVAANAIAEGGKAISFGWNSNGLGKSRGFRLLELYVIAHGAASNDTLITVEQKTAATQLTFY